MYVISDGQRTTLINDLGTFATRVSRGFPAWANTAAMCLSTRRPYLSEALIDWTFSDQTIVGTSGIIVGSDHLGPLRNADTIDLLPKADVYSLA